MDYIYSNARSIIRGWKEKWNRNNSLSSAQNVEDATGDYPDSKLYVSRSKVEKTMTEDELIIEAINNPQHIW